MSVKLDSLDESENKILEEKIKKYYGVCGCGEGKTAGVVTLIIFLALLCSGLISIKVLGIAKTIGLYFLIAFINMFFSKVYTILNARKRLNKLVQEVQFKTINL
ncbi:MAG: hypothetical protein ABI844_01535 [Saprospiraceae bacterium]